MMVEAMTHAPTARLGRMLAEQIRSQVLIRWRIPAFSLTNLALPIIFFTFFGLPLVNQTAPDGTNLGAFVLASFAAYAVGSIMVFSFGIGVATERAMRMDVLIRATPLPPGIYILAKVVTALLFALVSLVLLIGYGVVVGGIRQEAGVWISIVFRLLAGSLPFIGLGFAIGYLTGPNAAPAVANLVYLPLVFASGFFLPLNQLPAFIRRVAPYLPTYHYAQLAWSAVGRRSEPLLTSLLWVAGYSILFLAIAVWAYQRDETSKFL
jgi:ABC-2 type transport system permease protein